MSFFAKVVDTDLLYNQTATDGTWTEITATNHVFQNIMTSAVTVVKPLSTATIVTGITDFNDIFYQYIQQRDLSALEELDLSGFDAANSQIQFYHVLYDCSGCALLKMPKNVVALDGLNSRGVIHGQVAQQFTLDCSENKITSFRFMFDSNNLSSVTVINADIDGLSDDTTIDFGFMFRGSTVAEVDLHTLNVSEKFVNMQSMFLNCYNLTRVKMPRFKRVNTSGLWQAGPLADCFSGAARDSEDLYIDFNSSTPYSLKLMFANCRAVDLYITALYWTDIFADSRGTFQNSTMEHIYVERDWPTGFTSVNCFLDCSNLIGQPDGFSYDATKTGGQYAKINDGQDGYFSPLVTPDFLDVVVTPAGAATYTTSVSGNITTITWNVTDRYTFLNAVLISPGGTVTRFDSLPTAITRTEAGIYQLGANFTSHDDPYTPVIPIDELPSDIIQPDFPYSSIEKYANMGLYKIFIPDDTQFRNFTGYLYSNTFADALKNLWNRIVPIDDLIVSVKVLPCKPVVAGQARPKVGWVSFAAGTEMDYTIQQYVDVSLGTLRIDPVWRSYLDYAPYTSLNIYLPFIGARQLDISDVMASTISLHYIIDTLSGDCTAYIMVDGSIHYQFVGNCGYQIPISSSDVNSMMMAPLKALGKAAGMAATAVAVSTGNPVAAAAGFALQGKAVEDEDGSVQVSSNIPGPVESTTKPSTGMIDSLVANSGFMTVVTPYLFIERVIPSIPDGFGSHVGYVSNKLCKLASLSGYTKVAEINLDNIPASEAEKSEIIKLLKGGVEL